MGQEIIPQENNPKLLGVVFDPTFTFCAHASAIARKACRRLGVLRAVADSRFGHDKECLVRPFFDYAAPIVSPNYSPTSFHKLQLVQNKALRLITGAHAAAAQDHLHEEMLILPVKDHIRLLAAQHLVKTLQPSHPSHELVTSTPAARQRRKKETLRSSCWSVVEPFLSNGTVPPGELSMALKSVHTKVVEEAVADLGEN